MDTMSSIPTWMNLVQLFCAAFTAPGAEIFVALVSGWVLCTGRRTITGILPFADPDGRRAHDAFHRFFPDARWEMHALWKPPAILLVKLFAASGTIELDLDDTLFHRCGRKVDGAGGWRDPAGKQRDDFFFTTDLSLTGEHVIGGFAGCWSIEDTFKNTKQFLGGQQPQTYKGQGPERAVMLSLWLGSLLWLWFLQQPTRTHKVAGPAWYPGKMRSSFQDAPAALRRHLWSQRIETTCGTSLGHCKNLVVFMDAVSRAA